MKNNNKYYKVVMKVLGKSLVSTTAQGNSSVIYFTDGRITRPNNGQNPFLFIFKCLKTAKQFKKSLGNPKSFQIWKVEAFGVSKLQFSKFGPDQELINSNVFPPGTLFVSFLKMLKQVKS